MAGKLTLLVHSSTLKYKEVMSTIVVTPQVVALLVQAVNHNNKTGITSVPCGEGTLEQALGPNFQVVGIDVCREQLNEPLTYQFIVVNWRDSNWEEVENRAKFRDYTLCREYTVNVDINHILLFCWSIDRVPWEMYARQYIQDGGNVIVVIFDNTCAPNRTLMADLIGMEGRNFRYAGYTLDGQRYDCECGIFVIN